MKMQLFTKSYARDVIIGIAFVIIIGVMLLTKGYTGTEPFHNLRLASNLALIDDLSFGGRVATYSWGTPILLSPMPKILSWILPILLGLTSIILLEKILKKFKQKKRTINIALLFYVLSPTFIYIFSSANNFFVPFFLSILVFYLVTKEKYSWWVVPIVFIMPMFSILFSTATIVMLFFYAYFRDKKKKKIFLYSLIANVVSNIAYYGTFFYLTGFSIQKIVENTGKYSIFSNLFYDFGSTYGLGIFLFILACGGMAINWKDKYKSLFVFFTISTLFIATIFRTELLPILTIFTAVFAAKGFKEILRLRWSSKEFKKFAIFLMVLGISFSTVSQITTIIHAKPTNEIMDALDFLKEQEQGTVFTDYSRGVWVTWAGHKNVIDENYQFVQDLDQRIEDSKVLFYSRDLEEIMPIIEKYEIKYIWIDKEMKEKIWTHENQGLLFVAKYTKEFSKIYETEEVEIWRINNV